MTVKCQDTSITFTKLFNNACFIMFNITTAVFIYGLGDTKVNYQNINGPD